MSSANTGKRRAEDDGGGEPKRACLRYGKVIRVKVTRDPKRPRVPNEDDERTFSVHKDVLQCSEYFRDLTAKDTKKEELTLENIADCFAFEQYLDWLYHGEIDKIHHGASSKDLMPQAMLDGYILRTICNLLLLAVKLDDTAFGDYVWAFLILDEAAWMNDDAFRYFPLRLEEGIVLWNSRMCKGLRSRIADLVLPGLKRTVLSANCDRCPEELYICLSQALPCSYKVYVGNDDSQEVIRVNNRLLPVASTLFRRATEGSHDEEGAWIIPLEQHTPKCFYRYLRCVELMEVHYEDIVDAPFEDHNGVRLPVAGETHREQLMHNLCEIWMLAEHVDDKLTRDACMRHIIDLWTNHGFMISWDTLHFIGNEVPKYSRLRKWAVDTVVPSITTDAADLLAKLPAALLSQLLVAAAVYLRKGTTRKDRLAMVPHLKDLHEYCDK
ncbi:hypothetical protein AC578_5959 [Lecanosticta acicola]|uniref:BTB domain-containing protein n=1 Tax=Lecanosticta acicola TaxID=111012 RepID=A0AAI8W253_9PEZI|nr:hypothetical protein AC578_5959 [Lecanosticta acicola]